MFNIIAIQEQITFGILYIIWIYFTLCNYLQSRHGSIRERIPWYEGNYDGHITKYMLANDINNAHVIILS